MKRYIAIALLLFAAVCFTLSGCNNNGSSKSSASNTLFPNSKTVTLSLYFPGNEPGNFKKVISEIERRVKDTLNVKLDVSWLGLNYQEEMKKLLSSGKSMDLFLMSPERDFENLTSRKHYYKDLTNLFPQYAPGLYSQYTSGDLDSVKIKGKILYLPNLNPTTTANYVVVRKDLMSKYNISDIKTFNDYTAFLKKVKDNEPLLIPGCIPSDTNKIFINALGYESIGYNHLVYKKGASSINIEAWEQTTGFRKMLQYLSSWKSDGLVFQNSSKFSSAETALKFGRLASYVVTEQSYFSQQDIQSTPSLFPLVTYRLYPENKVDIIPSFAYLYSNIAISENSKNAAKALMLVNWIESSQENYDLFMYGIKGKDYVLGKDGSYSLPGSVNIDVPASQKFYLSAFENLNYDRNASCTIVNIKSDRKNFIKNYAEYPAYKGFWVDEYALPKKIRTSYEKWEEFYENNIYQSIDNGSYEFDNTNNYLIELQDMKGDKLVSAIQAQFDKWRKQLTPPS